MPIENVFAVRFAVTPNHKPYNGEADTQRALSMALDDLILGEPSTGQVGRGLHWITESVLEAKVIGKTD